MAETNDSVGRMLAVYESAIRSFVVGSSSADDFEARFLALFKNDKYQVPGPEFDVLDSLFADVDDYVADPDLRNEVGGIGEQELRERARSVYSRLYGSIDGQR
ncbi:hypothetical protein FEK35_19850 [Nocardia cyriacigeorgica]|uniref:Colicin D immunity protein domain-containing protein n=1 Tax=Nocardia cyriacigeorgica TaxID=135487 RepID=A0A5R8PA44_9NOCA|nr:colicin immunity domain-containing protein [Nocardia cyriacigeorgica]TLG04686.1 hypothetical protein FEK35_19850 [Nocardia cyriacigeorgica]